MNNKKWLITAAFILILTVFVSCAADNGGGAGTSTDRDAVDAVGTVSDKDVTGSNTTDSDTVSSEAASDAETNTNAETETETETTAEPEPIVIPEYTNPLTGLASDTDLSDHRPVAIMINNLKKANPQHGVSDADIMYEVLAEGGITRLLMLVTEYEKLGVVGSVRSARHYYLDYVRDFDAIYVHAGGSPMAYEQIDAREFANLDGVNMNLGDMFYRDAWRKENMGTEHSLMTTGEGIVSGIKQKKYRTGYKDSYENPLSFVEYGTRVSLDGEAATHVRLKYHKNQVVDLVYDASTDTYLRYQFGGKAHIDNNNGAQLAFDNVVIVLTDMWVIDGDEYNRLDVITTGEGDGYYIAGGKYIPIKWSKPDGNTPLTITDMNGFPVEYNRGKTFISVFDKDSSYTIDDSEFTAD